MAMARVALSCSAAYANNGVTLEIHRGSAAAFVGPSGAGKTTAVNAIVGLLEPTRGRLCVDGQDIRDNPSGWQRQVGYIPQDIYLCDDTLRRNIAFSIADHSINEKNVTAAVTSAQVQGLVDALPAGLDTVVGERGMRLSGGQRQQIAIARALYHDPQVLVMDEATSSLDNETERHIMQAIERLCGDRTIIIIAHRLATVRHCDRFFLLENGRLEAFGNYGELLRTSQSFCAAATA